MFVKKFYKKFCTVQDAVLPFAPTPGKYRMFGLNPSFSRGKVPKQQASIVGLGRTQAIQVKKIQNAGELPTIWAERKIYR